MMSTPARTHDRHVHRRSVIAAGAWSIPVIAVAAAAPAFAASTCEAVPFPTNWSLTLSGSFRGATSGSQGYMSDYASTANGANPVDSINRYVSERDNSIVTDNSQAAAGSNATVTLERALTLVPGRAYTFSFSIASRFAGDNSTTSQNQYLQIQTVVGGVASDRLSFTKGEKTGTYLGTGAVPASYIRLPELTADPAVAATKGVRSQTYSFTYTPPAGASSVTLRYLWTLPALGRANGVADYTGNADIAASAPTITGVGC